MLSKVLHTDYALAQPSRQIQTTAMMSAQACFPPTRLSLCYFSGFSRALPLKQGNNTSTWAANKLHQHTRGRTGNLLTRVLFERFTERAIKGVMYAQKEAKALFSTEVGAEHVLLGFLALAPDASKEYMGSSVTVENARSVLEGEYGHTSMHKDANAADLPFTQEAKRVFEAAQTDSRKQRMAYITQEHVLIALLSSSDFKLQKLLSRLRVDIKSAKEAALKKLEGDQESEGVKQTATVGAGSSRREGSGKKSSGKPLEEFCRDLCEMARQQRIDPVIGRDKEVARTIQILARRSKNNPILLGQPGTGKTAIAEGLALAIAKGIDSHGEQVPVFLRDKRILQLDVGLLVSGAKERGELEKRITGLLEDCLTAGNIILMIDEIHTLIGTGAVGRTSGFAGGGLDISNLLKPALARGRLQVIGATTLDEHRRYFEKDAALERRFQPVYVGEPTASESLDILRGLQERYERHHKCIYSEEALQAAVALSMRYIADRFLPDKAIDLLDEAGSRARIAAYTVRKDSQQVALDLAVGPNLELQQVLDAKATYVLEQLWEEASLLRERELDLKQRLSAACYGLPEGAVLPSVGPNDIAQIVASWTGIPAAQLSQDECLKVLHLGPSLKERVIGQDAAVESIARAVQRARSGLGDPERPVAAMLFSGPTGVGKTELARSLADTYFGSPASLVRLDMSEYMEHHTVSRLVGAPPGFLGYGEGGALTEAVRRQPHCLLLLDEMEKAHPDVVNLLLQVLEDGRLTDSQGRTVSFKHALIVMTSNVGSSQITGGRTLGFGLPSSDLEDGQNARIRSLVMDELKAYFRPELLNRLDEVVVFRQLSKPEVRKIADLLLAQSAERIKERGLSLQLSRPLMVHLLEEGFDQEYGARPLKRAITRLVEDPLADAILGSMLSTGDTAFLDLAPDNRTVTVQAKRITPLEPVVVRSEIVARPSSTKPIVKENVSVNA